MIIAMPWPPPTHIDSSPNCLSSLEAVDQGGHDAGAGHAEGVAEGDRATVTLSLSSDAEVLGRADDLRRRRPR
jgi:hypothetical protein